MTFRAVVLGLIGVSIVCGFSYFNDNILQQTLSVGNSMPATVYGGLMLFMLLVNPLLSRLKRRYSLRGGELAVALTLTLAACVVPESGLLRTFTASIIMPHHYYRTEPGWKEQKVIEIAPKHMLVDPSEDESLILNGFIQGLGTGDQHISPSQIPWHAWLTPLAFWIPLVLALWVALIALSVVIHKQWSAHEQLPYPIATFAISLLPSDDGSTPSIFKSKPFWIATGIIFLMNFNNYLCQWFPDKMIHIPTTFSLVPLRTLFPTFIAGGGERLLNVTLYMTPIAVAYLLATDVSFSLGLGPFLWFLAIGFFGKYGISLTGSVEGASWYTSLKPQTFLLFGANLGVFLTILYTGRHYYLNIVRQSLIPSKTDQSNVEAVWGFRVFVFALVVFIAQLVFHAGLELHLSLFYTFILVLFYVVMSRVLAETGLFYIQPFFFPCVVIWGVFGAKALGPRTMMIMFLLTMVFVIDPRESLMPFMVNSFKVLEAHRVRIGKTAAVSVIAVLLGLSIALPLCLWFQYDLGVAKWDMWASYAVPRMPFENVAKIQQRLAGQDALALAESLQGFERYQHLSPNRICMISLLVGLALVFLLTAGRLRFPKWPLHPVLLLTWSTEPLLRMCSAFLVGWFIKVIVVKYGGRGAYQRFKPVMLGLIAGEILGVIFPMLIGVVYYLITGDQPKAFRILPS